MYGDQSVLVYDFLSAFALVPGQVLCRCYSLPYKGSMGPSNPRVDRSLEGRLFGGITAGSSASVRFVVTVTSIVVVSSRLRVLLRFTGAGTLFRFGLSRLLFSWLVLDWGRVRINRVCFGRGVLHNRCAGLSDSLVECVIVIFSCLFK